MAGALIIGGCGHIGSALGRHLVARGYAVTGLDYCQRGSPPESAAQPFNWTFDYGTVSSKFLEDFDEIILLAGYSSVAMCRDDPFGAIQNNIVNLVGLISKLGGQKLIYASSGSVYSQTANSIYDFTKQTIDRMVPLIYPRHWGLRLATVCGASPNVRTDLVINGMVKSALSEGVIRVANPQIKRPILAMSDFCRGIEAILADDVPPGIHDLKSFNSTIGMLAEKIAKLLGVRIEVAPVHSSYDFTMACAPWLKPIARIETIVDDLLKHHRREWQRK